MLILHWLLTVTNNSGNTKQMTREEAEEMIKELLPHSFRESQFLTPEPVYLISAMKVFDVIREASDPPITEAEFNIMSDGLKS